MHITKVQDPDIEKLSHAQNAITKKTSHATAGHHDVWKAFPFHERRVLHDQARLRGGLVATASVSGHLPHFKLSLRLELVQNGSSEQPLQFSETRRSVLGFR